MSDRPDIDDLVAAHRPGYNLAQRFYTDPEIFQLDLERVFFRNWVFVGHVSRVPNDGDYFLFTIGAESIIIIRDKNSEIQALFNVCRHRGSRICREASGNRQTLVCPYHAWAYANDGTLLSAPAMPAGFDAAEFGLRKCHVRIVEGMIFICLGEPPRELDAAFADFERFAQPHDLAHAGIAHRAVWRVNANWKLVVENFSECYHCGPAHPEYCTVMLSGVADTRRAARAVEQLAQATATWESVARRQGQLTDNVRGAVHHCKREPIREGFLTQSRNGELLAPLMGSFRESDGGVTSGRLWPVSYFLACCDHAILPRFTPIGPQCTEIEMTWLVDARAVAGTDYDRNEMTWLWLVTTEQDNQIIEDNQAGVNSLAYQPGPYSTTERTAQQFTLWYLDQLTPEP